MENGPETVKEYNQRLWAPGPKVDVMVKAEKKEKVFFNLQTIFFSLSLPALACHVWEGKACWRYGVQLTMRVS